MVKFDLKEVREDIARNRTERRKFVTLHARWVKRTPNMIWSRQQRRMLDSVIWTADKVAKSRAKGR